METNFLIVLIFIAVLLGGVYWYAGYSTRSGFAKDENKNFIPDAWEGKYSWIFSSKGMIMLVLGIGIGFLLAKVLA
jgi:hypothetical protein